MPRMVTAASVAVAVRCVGTACTTAPSPTAVVLDLQEQQGVSVHPRSPRRAAEAGAAPARAVMLRLSGTSARARRYRRPSPQRRQGAAPATPSWLARSVPWAGRLGTRAAPAPAARRRWGRRAGRLALFSAVEEVTAHKSRPPVSRWVGDRGAVPIDEPAKRVDIPPFPSPHAAAQRCGGVCDAPLDVGAGGRGGASSVRPPDSAVDASNAGRRDLGARGAPPDSLQATRH